MLVLLYSKLIWAAFGRPFSFLVGAFDDGASAFFIEVGMTDQGAAKLDLQKGFMRLTRSIAQPTTF